MIDDGSLEAENYDILWSNGSTTFSIEATQPGSYSVTVTDPLGCNTSYSQFNLVLDTPPIQPTIIANGIALAASSVSGVTYQWNLDGVPIQNANAQFYTAVNTGYYTVSVINSSGCITTSDPVYVLVTSTEEIPNEKEQIELYPNPSSGLIEITYEKINPSIKLTIYNIIGQKVMQLSPFIESSSVTLDLSSVAKGTYFMEFNIENKRVTKKLLLTN